MKKINEKKIAIAGLVVFPVVHFYLLEAYTHNGLTEIRPWSQIFNILLYEMTAGILTCLFRNTKWALRAEGIFAMLMGLLNAYVYSFRSLPLVPWDILSWKTAFSVAENYNFVPTLRMMTVAAGFILVLFLEGVCTLTLKKWKWYQSLLAVLAGCLIFVSFSHVLQQENFQNRHRMYNKLFTPVRVWQVNGFFLTMIMEIPYLSVDKPEGYDAEEAEALLAEYEQTASLTEENTCGTNIIVMMDEAFSDLAVLGDFEASEDYMPYFHSLWNGGKNTISGYLHVSVCGGNTANTEFEFLTGNTMAFLPQGSIPYQQYLRKETEALPAFLRKSGYQTYAMHPYYAGGWDRDTVYPLLGFAHAQFLPDYSYREYIRDYVSDRTCVQKIIDTYEKKEKDSPVFIFNVTMQNHGSYGEKFENFTPDIMVEGVNSYSLSAYLSLLKETDQALEEMLQYFSHADEPVLVVFFGDHQPNDTVAQPILQQNGMSYDTLTEEQRDLRYQVPYIIWSNYAMDTRTGEDTSANFLACKVLRAAGIPLSPYQTFLEELSAEYPVISARKIEDKEGERMELKEDTELLRKYKKIQYYQLFEK